MDTLDYVPSDTVHSALENLTHMGIDHGIDRVSSMYPMAFTGSGGPVLTVPMPIDLKIQLLDLVSKKYVNDYSKIHTAIKRIKKLAYIPLDCLYEPTLTLTTALLGFAAVAVSIGMLVITVLGLVFRGMSWAGYSITQTPTGLRHSNQSLTTCSTSR